MTDRRAEVHETHSAVVLMFGDHAYKMKKAVDLGFLDFRDEQTRRQVCLRELELNRRLAPDVYLDTITVTGADGHTYEHGVLMRRMPAETRLATLIARGEPVADHLDALALLIARFHATAERGPAIAAEGMAGGLRRRWSDNLRESEQYKGTFLDAGLHERISDFALRYVDGRTTLLAERAEAGLVVDGHGDLLAEDVYCLPDYPRVLDCIEFDDRLRWVDVLDDVAFLAMDLEYLGHPDLAAHFLRCYADHSGTPVVPTLRNHYIAYRAFVRTKVLCIQAAQGRDEATAEADRYARLALRHLEDGEVRLVLVGGGPGTGKTTVARGLAGQLGAVLLSSDTIRQELAQPAEQRYSAAGKQQTYRALLDRAAHALAHGECVVADATWGDRAMRELAARTAAGTESRVVALQCTAPVEVAAARAQRRLDSGGSQSEADAAVARELAADRTAWPEAVLIDTSGGDPAAALARAVTAVSAADAPKP